MASVAFARDLASLSDAELAPLLQRGDRAAITVVVRRHNQRLFRAARSVTRDDAEAEDVVQETYVRAFAGLARFRGESRLSTWLTRIAINEALDRMRRQKPQVELHVVDSEPVQPGPNARADPERDAARAEIRRLVEGALDDLPEAFRVVFVLRDIEELTIEETADYLGIRPETVKTRLHRARRLLRARLDDALASALDDAFPFAGARCDRMTEAVLRRLGIPDQLARR